MTDSGVGCGHAGVRTGSRNEQAALESLLDAFCRNAYSNIRQSRKLLQRLAEVMLDSGRVSERQEEIEQLCDEAESWVRERYEQQVADTIAAKRLAYLAEREEVRLKNLLRAIESARQATRDPGSTKSNRPTLDVHGERATEQDTPRSRPDAAGAGTSFNRFNLSAQGVGKDEG